MSNGLQWITLLCEYLAQNNLPFFSFPFCKWCPRFLQWDTPTLYISLSTSPPSCRPTRADSSRWLPGELSKELKKRVHLQIHLSLHNPTATSCQIMCLACRTSPKVLPRPPCCRVIALLCWRQPDLPRFRWEVEPNFYKIEKYHDFTWACKSDCYSPRGLKHSCASENKIVSGWFRVLGGAHGILEMGSLLFMLTVSTQKEDGRFFQLLGVWQKPFLFGEYNPNLMYNFLYIFASQQSNIFVSWRHLSQQVWLRGQSITDIATTVLL